MKARALLVLLAAGALIAAEPAAAPDRPLASPTEEARARALFVDIRCVVCQHESIADSPAGIAGDMRRLVREQIAAGRTDAEVRADLTRRFGDYVLFRPPFRLGTLLLWLGPLVLVLGALGGMLLSARRRPVEAAPLTPQEEARLADVLQTESSRPDVDASSPHAGR